MTIKRFLNVEYNNVLAKVDISPNRESMEDMSQVMKEVLLAYREIPVGYSRLQLWNKNVTPHIRLRVFNDIETLAEQYFWDEIQPGFLCLSVQLDSTPIQSTNSELRGDTFTSSINVKRKRRKAILPMPSSGVCDETGWLEFLSSHRGL